MAMPSPREIYHVRKTRRADASGTNQSLFSSPIRDNVVTFERYPTTNKGHHGDRPSGPRPGLFKAAATLWTNTALRPDQYAQPVLALIALRQMEAKFLKVHAELQPKFTGRLKPTPADYRARGAMFVPDNARFSRLLALPGNANLGAELNGGHERHRRSQPRVGRRAAAGYAACRTAC